MPFRHLSRAWAVALLAACCSSLLGAARAGETPARSSKQRRAADHWAFQTPRRPTVPNVHDRNWVQTPVDAFILARLERDGIRPAPRADWRTLLRRVYLELIGLPPTPAEQEAFLLAPSPTAYARVVDDLLSRPAYGERWARHWLDVVRYAETNGYERDGDKPSAWRYRDYVIDAFNADKPFDRFLIEQLAGDEIPDSNAETQIATTFLRLGTWDDEPADPLVDRYDQLDDVLGTTATAFLGLTLRCARCHDHKFEPFTQKDYYQLLAVFEPLQRPLRARDDLDRHVGTAAEIAAYERALAELTAAQKSLESLENKSRERVLAAVVRVGPPRRNEPAPVLTRELALAYFTEPTKRTNAQKELVAKMEAALAKVARDSESASEKAQRLALEQRIAKMRAAKPREPARAYVWFEDSPTAPKTHIFRRGDPTKPGIECTPAVPAVLTRQPLSQPQPRPQSTGRRLWLANWLTRSDQPLVARVIVNRVWQHHFGDGLVATENDFGFMGQPPTHPELLDWLATEFIASGWRVKALHRLLVLSNAYQMASTGETGDTDGSRLSHWRQRRLEAEVVRDSILAVSGQLNRQPHGPSVYPPLPRAVMEGQSRPGDGWGRSDNRSASRRSIYLFVKRSLAIPELDLLDAPDTTSSCEQRAVSTTGPQALTFLNGDFILKQARYLAQRLKREAGPEAGSQIEQAFRLALCRPPGPEERSAAVAFLHRQAELIRSDARGKSINPDGLHEEALAAFCLVLLNTNEFVYCH